MFTKLSKFTKKFINFTKMFTKLTKTFTKQFTKFKHKKVHKNDWKHMKHVKRVAIGLTFPFIWKNSILEFYGIFVILLELEFLRVVRPSGNWQ